MAECSCQIVRCCPSCFGIDLENMIQLKVALGGAESTYLSRAQSFDRFCVNEYPNLDCLTEALALEWIKDAGNAARTFFLGSLLKEDLPHTYIP